MSNEVDRQEVVSSKADNHELLNELIRKYGMKTLSTKMNLSAGTIKRWIELNDIPQSYEFDLLKLSGIKIDYSAYSSKQKDQFFTPLHTAKQCFDIFRNVIETYNENIDDFTFIEPSAGDGSFIDALPANKTIAMDIEPRRPSIIQQDYLQWKPPQQPPQTKRYTVFGNPPFGLRGHLALQFINHSYEFAEYVCFILPHQPSSLYHSCKLDIHSLFYKLTI